MQYPVKNTGSLLRIKDMGRKRTRTLYDPPGPWEPVDEYDLGIVGSIRCYSMNKVIQIFLVQGRGIFSLEQILPTCRDVPTVRAYIATFNEVFSRRHLFYRLGQMTEQGRTFFRLLRPTRR